MKRLIAACALVVAAQAVHAQSERATLAGVVRDSQGAVLQNATVTVTNVATNVATKVKTTNTGTYLVVNLVSGQYLVEAESQGLQKQSQVVILETGQRGGLDFTLGVGGVTEQVTVQEARRLLSTEQAALGSVVDQMSVAKLPLAIRNWDDLLALVPGVQGDRYTDQGGGTSFGRTGGVNVHGARALYNNFLLDGVDNNSISENVQELATQVSRPSVDAIQEFKVVTSPYSAEYGRSPGAAISVATKSGTNQFHGTVYDFYRNKSMDSVDFFTERNAALNNTAVVKPRDDQNQIGANVGGPIVKDKAFFFVDYEGTRITRDAIRLTNVPTADQRAGIFTTAIRDPLTGQNFPGNQIPSNRIDPYAASIIGLVPLPNQGGANNYFRQGELVDNADRVMGRIDLRASPTNNMFARYVYSSRDRQIPGAFGGVVDGTGTSAFGNQTIKSNAVVGGWTHILSATTVNEFRFSWSQATSDAQQQPFGQAPPAAATIPGTITNPIVAGGLQGITIDGFFGGSGLGRIGSPDFLPKFQHTNQFEFVDSISWLHGNHAFKFGADIISPMKNQFMDVPATRGALRFRNAFTGNPMADYLLGYVSDLQLSNVYVVDQRHWATMFYAQDDWKLTPKLSLNLGLRYDFITPAMEAQDRQTNFIPGGAGQLVFAKAGSLEDRGLVKPDRNNFAPRVGLVYKLDDKTVIRGGYGIFYNLFDRVGSEDQLSLNLPGLNNTTITQTSGSPVFFLRQGIPGNFLDPPNLDPAAGQLRTKRFRVVNNNAPKFTLNQASLGFQRELVKNWVLSFDGIWTKGSDLATLVNLNQPLPNAAGNNALGALPYPNFGFLEWRDQNGKSEYKGIDIGLERRFAHGYSFGIAYTLGDSKDNSSEQLTTQGSNAFPQIARDFTNWYGPSDYDVRHRLAVNFVAELPFGKGKKWAQDGAAKDILGGWVLSGIYAYRSGRPYTVNQSNSNVGTNMTGLPNVVGDIGGARGCNSTTDCAAIAQWFNPAAFQAVTSGTFGNEVRNQFRGPDWASFDFSLQRKIDFGTRMGLTLRWDVFNLFNRTNLGLPNRDVGSPSTLGTISSLAGDPRLMQLSARITF